MGLKSRAVRIVGAAALAVPALIAAPASPALAAGELTVIQLAVGQGDSALFIGPCGTTGLLDAGDGSAEALYEQFASWDDRTGPHWVAVSHYDADHIGDVPLVNAGGPGRPVGGVLDRGGGAGAKDTQA